MSETNTAAPAAASGGETPARSLSLGRIPVEIQVVLGAVTMPIGQIAASGAGSVIRLDSRIGDPVDILVNGRLFGRGEIVVLEEGEPHFAVSLTEIVGDTREG